MQTVALLAAVAVVAGVLRLGEASPVPPPAPATPTPPAATETDTERRPATESRPDTAAATVIGSDSDSSAPIKVGSSMHKREALPSPSAALMVRLTRRCDGIHSQRKREASPVTGASASLSINNPIRVLRNRLTLQMYRRWRNKVRENSAFLHSKGKRSTRGQLERRSQGLLADRFTEEMKQWLLS